MCILAVLLRFCVHGMLYGASMAAFFFAISYMAHSVNASGTLAQVLVERCIHMLTHISNLISYQSIICPLTLLCTIFSLNRSGNKTSQMLRGSMILMLVNLTTRHDIHALWLILETMSQSLLSCFI